MRNSTKYFIISLSLFLLFLTFSGKEEERFVIEFETEIYNFGKVNEGEKVLYTFVFANKGKETIKIDNVRPACGCTVMGDYDHEVQPGKKGKIDVQLNTTGFEGEVNKVITVTTNIPGKETIILTLQGTIYSPIAVMPKSLWLGRIRKDELSLTGNFTIKNNSETPLELLQIIPPNDRTTVKVNTVKVKNEYIVELTVAPPFQNNRVDEFIIIKTNNPDKKQLTLRYIYDVQAEIFVYPETIFLEPGPIAQKTEKFVRVESSFSEPISILYPQFIGTPLKYTIKEETKGQLFIITFMIPEKFELKKKDVLIFTFQVKKGEEITVYNIPIKRLEPNK